SSNGSRDVFVSKLNTAGDYIWGLSFGGSGEDSALHMFVDSEDNIYITGVFNDTVDFDSGTGVFELTSQGNNDGFLVKLDTEGNFIWAISLGGNMLDTIKSIAFDSSQNILITGYFQETVDFNPGPNTENLTASGDRDMYVLKLDTNGQFEWVKQFGGTSVEDGIFSNGIAIDTSNNIVIAGSYEGSVDFDPSTAVAQETTNGLGDIFILKLDLNGNYLWNIAFGSSEDWDTAYSIVIDNFNNIYISGSFSNEMDVDPSNDIFLLNTPSGQENAFAIKYSGNGALSWAKSIGGAQFTRSYNMTLDNEQQPLISIKYTGTVDFDPGVDESFLTSNGGFDVGVLRLNDHGDFNWARSMGGADTDFPLSITTDSQNNILTAGYFYEIGDYDPSSDIFNLTSAGGKDAFIVKLTNGLLGTNAIDQIPAITLFPNPTDRDISIDLGGLTEHVEVQIYNLNRQLVGAEQFSNINSVTIPITGAAGVYVCRLSINERVQHTFKILKN
ncbi:MAG: SBBP repeat-containing protein, partial [Marinirhabdus sp.]|nr:SBBP repeat-containing protein [Marinirhabdus sp.]